MNDRSSPPEPFLARASRQLLGQLDELVDEVAREIVAKEPAYGSFDLVPPEDLRRSNRENLAAILRHLSGDPRTGVAVPKETGEVRAQQGIPLAAVLRAYRIGSTVAWNHLLRLAAASPEDSDELLRAASHVWELIDDYSQAFTAGYQNTVATQVLRDTHMRAAALDALLVGHLDAARLWECAALLRLPHSGSYAVVSAAAGAAPTEAVPVISAVLASRGVRSEWRVQLDSHVGIVALTPTFTVDRLVDAVAERTRGRVGVSAVFDSLEDTPNALRQAQLACTAAQSDICEVLRYDDALVPVLIAAVPEVAAALQQSVLGPLLDLPPHDRDTLLATARCWFASGGETNTVAASMFCHRNTVRFRLNRMAELTGRDLSDPVGASEMYLALHAHRMSQAVPMHNAME